MKKNKGLTVGFWRYMVGFWTILLFFVIVEDFISVGGLENIIGPIAAIYTASLTIYSAEKEFERWRNYSLGKHPGELYVILWTVLIATIFILSYITNNHYRMSPEILATYIVVLGVLAITRKSKNIYIEKCEPLKKK